MHNISITGIELARLNVAVRIAAHRVLPESKAAYLDLLKVINSQTGLSKGGK